MANFVAFRFCDNDFHHELREAINYVVENRSEELTIESFKELVVRGTVAFGMLRRIDNYSASQPYTDYRSYIEETLTVTEVARLSDLDGRFEGYVFSTHTLDVFYVGY